ncbi:hypothetical protein KIK06_18060 [Nocardiopsis sp. EMB25]|uniref:hypothetical protein n=1 Tax=Nocardiopsis sp. EMB25 TaxID=2835867 RepID=UPI0022844C30|nr:hypothetical protein [Nocardiopsis sp. EMB25]MCY9785796.1 hypothetical protein [Nocardiopsis sp. EMB25]
MSSTTEFVGLRSRLASRTAGLFFSSLLVLGGGLAVTAPASAAEVGAAACYGYTSVNASRSIAGTVTDTCGIGRSWARHGRYYAQTAWTTSSSRAYAADYYGATPRYSGWQIAN